MADEIDYEIIGDDMQIVEIELDPDEAVQAEAGAMAYMGPGVQMQTGLGNEGWWTSGRLEERPEKSSHRGEFFYYKLYSQRLWKRTCGFCGSIPRQDYSP